MDALALLANNMRQMRKTAHLSQEKLGLAAGLNRTYIGSIERQEANPSIRNVQRIIDALGTSPTEIFGETVGANPAGQSSISNSGIPAPKTQWSLCENTQSGYTFHPIDVHSGDLSMRILAFLIDEGYKGSKLVKRYNELEPIIMEFAKTRSRTKR